LLTARNKFFAGLFVVLAVLGTALFLYAAGARTHGGDGVVAQEMSVEKGDGARAVAERLMDAHLIRSEGGFYLVAVASGSAFHIKPGTYALSSDMSTWTILKKLVAGPDLERTVTIWEGATIYDIDATLSSVGVLKKGAFIASSTALEGYLFPDTYRFFVGSTVGDVIDAMRKNFEAKAAPLLPTDPKEAERVLIIASMLEKEVPEPKDRQLVAGIIEKRLSADMPLQIDATICYIQQMRVSGVTPCYPLKTLDFQFESDYNTYLRRGLPPHPISNPGTEAIQAARAPLHSPYWFYLSDPATDHTIFAVTLDEQNRNRVKYLK
jgi:UPF0755 protein